MYGMYVCMCVSRTNCMQQIEEVNKFLGDDSNVYGYKFISNSNITQAHIWKDGIHLNDVGTDILTNNFIRAINYGHV